MLCARISTHTRGQRENSPADKDYTVHRLLLATHTSGEDNNYLQIATVHLPKPQSDLDIEKYDDERGGE